MEEFLENPFNDQFFNIFFNKLLSLDFPKALHIEPTNACNINCRMCPRTKSKKPVGNMDLKTYKKIMDELSARGGITGITLHKDGEPLLNPDLVKMIRIAKDKNASKMIAFNTNGLLLDKKISEELVRSGLDYITISLDAFTKETYEKIKKGSDFEKVKENIKHLMIARERMESLTPKIFIQFIEMPENSKEKNDFFTYWSDKADKVIFHDFLSWGGVIDTDKEVPSERYACMSLWNQLAIDYDGDIVPCCLDFSKHQVLGNVKEMTLYEAWNGVKLKKLKDAHIKGDYSGFSFCKNCKDWVNKDDEFVEHLKKYIRDNINI
jgi:spiro-SPASM protein